MILGFYDVEYDGEMDENGAMCGIGILTIKYGAKYECTWLNDETHGICRFSAQHSLNIS